MEQRSEEPECTDPKPVIGYDFSEKTVHKKKKLDVQPVVLFRSICRGTNGQLEVRDEREIKIPSSAANQ